MILIVFNLINQTDLLTLKHTENIYFTTRLV